jgi:ATP-dependent Clp endopeptidase proteolytic subunit ClpP
MRSSAPGLNLVDSVYERLLSERIIFLGSQVDDDIANRLCAQVLLLAAEDPSKDIHLYINSPGGSISAGMAIYDTMVLAPCDVATYAMGMAASMGQFLLAARPDPDAPTAGWRDGQRLGHRDPGRAVRGDQEGDVQAQRGVHRSAD